METNYWVVLGLVLLIGEIFTMDFSLSCFALACFVAALLSAVGLGLYWQLAAVIITIFALLFTLRPLALKYLARRGKGFKSNVEALVGKETIVFGVEESNNKKAKTKIDADEWSVESDTPLKEKDIVKIEKIDGTTLIVRKEGN